MSYSNTIFCDLAGCVFLKAFQPLKPKIGSMANLKMGEKMSV